jgi:hypothetical protein
VDGKKKFLVALKITTRLEQLGGLFILDRSKILREKFNRLLFYLHILK